jgi:plastocyanin
MRKYALLFIGLAATTLLLAGCTASRPATASSAARTAQVEMPPSYRFDPASIQVAAGTTVTWTNSDNFTHSVQVQGQSDVHVVKPGESTQIKFDTPGTYSYICTFHPQNMTGTVVVVATSTQ